MGKTVLLLQRQEPIQPTRSSIEHHDPPVPECVCQDLQAGYPRTTSTNTWYPSARGPRLEAIQVARIPRAPVETVRDGRTLRSMPRRVCQIRRVQTRSLVILHVPGFESGLPGALFMRSMSGDFLFTISQFRFSDFQVFLAFPSHQPAATFSSRSSVSGYRRTSRTSAAA